MDDLLENSSLKLLNREKILICNKSDRQIVEEKRKEKQNKDHISISNYQRDQTYLDNLYHFLHSFIHSYTQKTGAIIYSSSKKIIKDVSIVFPFPFYFL